MNSSFHKYGYIFEMWKTCSLLIIRKLEKKSEFEPEEGFPDDKYLNFAWAKLWRLENSDFVWRIDYGLIQLC